MGVEELVGGTTLSPLVGFEGVPSPVAAHPPPVTVAAQLILDSNWNPFVSMDHHADFNVPAAPSSCNPGMQDRGISSSDGRPVDQIPGLKFFDSRKIVGPQDGGQNTMCLLPGDLLPSEEQGSGKDPKGKNRRIIPESGGFDDSSLPFYRIQTADAEQKKGVKIDKSEQTPGATAHKLTSEQAKGNSSSGDGSKEDYVHVRAKRGQAINSHSLAERVRREKISQRMKFLQDLVPGCSKITGKAVMLDEIINYVQSLQQQVEFLSMKLATVDPEMQFEVEQVFSTDILYSQTGNPGVPAIGEGIGTSHIHFRRPTQQGALQAHMSSSFWDDDLRNAVKMDFIANAHTDFTTKSPGFF